jgi:hypothetical protein
MVAWRPPEPVRCLYCRGDCWDNTASKRHPNGPDYKCKDCGAACWLEDEPNHWSWKPPLTRRID